MTFLSSCCPGTASDDDSDSSAQPARRVGGAPRGPPDHTHFDSNFSFANRRPRYSAHEREPVPTMEHSSERRGEEASQVSPRTVLRSSESIEGLKTSLDGRIPPQMSSGLVERLQGSPSSVYSRPTNSAAPTPTRSVNTVERVEGSAGDLSRPDSAPINQQGEQRAGQEASNLTAGRRGEMMGLEAKMLISEGLNKEREWEDLGREDK